MNFVLVIDMRAVYLIGGFCILHVFRPVLCMTVQYSFRLYSSAILLDVSV